MPSQGLVRGTVCSPASEDSLLGRWEIGVPAPILSLLCEVTQKHPCTS